MSKISTLLLALFFVFVFFIQLKKKLPLYGSILSEKLYDKLDNKDLFLLAISGVFLILFVISLIYDCNI